MSFLSHPRRRLDVARNAVIASVAIIVGSLALLPIVLPAKLGYPVALLAMGLFILWLVTSSLASLSLDLPRLYYRARQFLAPTATHGLVDRTFEVPADVAPAYTGRVRGWHVGEWAAKGPPTAMFGVMPLFDDPDRRGCLAIWGDQSPQFYFEHTPELSEIGPNYYDLRGSLFEVSLKQLKPLTCREGAELKVFVAAPIWLEGRWRSVCFHHREALRLDGDQWQVHRRRLDVADFEPQVQFGEPDRYQADLAYRQAIDRYIASIDNAGAKERVLARVAYVGIMYVTSEGFRNGVDVDGLLGVGHFKYGPDFKAPHESGERI